MKTIAIVNLKGGVGKTITAINLSAILATEYKQRVLLADADGQANATRMLLPPGEHTGLSTLLRGEEPYYENLIESSGIERLDVLPADSSLWEIDLTCMMGDGRGSFQALRDLRDAVMEDDAYDIMIIDCPPSFSAACVAGIMASNSIVIPVLPDAFSAEGMAELTAQIDGVRKLQPGIRVAGCLINQYHNADVVSDAAAYIRKSAPVPVFETVIRRTDKVLETTWAKEPLLKWSPRSSASRDYVSFTAELVRKEALCDGR